VSPSAILRTTYRDARAGRAQPTRASERGGRYASQTVSNLDRRSGYTPRRVREQRAYRMIVVGGAAGAVGVIGLVLSIAGVIGATLPVIAFIVAALCIFGFLRTTGQR
jgi:hypothetical protein